MHHLVTSDLIQDHARYRTPRRAPLAAWSAGLRHRSPEVSADQRRKLPTSLLQAVPRFAAPTAPPAPLAAPQAIALPARSQRGVARSSLLSSCLLLRQSRVHY